MKDSKTPLSYLNEKEGGIQISNSAKLMDLIESKGHIF
jgi:hypothetical protein